MPIFSSIELTLDCNLKCKHCYNFDRNKDINPTLRPLSFNQYKVLIDELVSEGAMFICFTGGEALLYSRLEELVAHVMKNNAVPRIKSNGILLTDLKIKSLKNAGVDLIDISIYGADDETYEAFSGINNGFSKMKKAFQAISDNDLNCSISIILHRHNVHQLEEMIDFCKSFNFNFQISDEITSRYTKDDGPIKDMALTQKQFETLLTGPYKDYFKYEVQSNPLQCNCARSVCGISVDGEVYPCIGAPIPSGNLHDDSFRNIWKYSKELNQIRDIKSSDFLSCQKCEYKSSCNRSSGAIFVNTDDYFGCDDQTLMKAQIRNEN